MRRSQRTPTITSKTDWLNGLLLGKSRWDWITELFIPTAGVAVLLLGISAVVQEISKSRTQFQKTARQQTLQNYLSSMAMLVADHNLSDQKHYEPGAIAANTLTRNAIEQLTVESERVNSETNLCSLDLQYCSSEKSTVVEALDRFYLLDRRGWRPSQPDFSAAEQAESRGAPPIVALAGLDLTNIHPFQLGLRGADLSSSNLRGSILRDAVLMGVNLTRANLSRADLSESLLWMADIRLADLSGANLEEADVSGADLQGTDLREASLYRATMRVVNLKLADLRGANLDRANLTRANLEAANLQGASLRGANLTGANLDSANLEGALYTDENSECPSHWLNDWLEPVPCVTQFPEGFDPEHAGLILWKAES